MTRHALHTARCNAARARLRHTRYLDSLVAGGGLLTVEQRATLDSLNADREQALDELEAVLHGMGVAA